MQLQLQHSKPGTRPSALSMDQGYLADLVKQLSFPRVYGTAANAKAEVIVADEFLRMFGACDRVGNTRNVCFRWPAEARILIGAHFDSVPNTPGADDNASAVAVMLAVAKALGWRRDVVAFNAEECNLAGSLEFVKEMAGELKALEQVHVLEMVGYRDRRPNSQQNPLPMIQAPTTADFLGIVANKGFLIDQIIEAAGRISVPVVGLAIPPGLHLEAIRQLSPHLLRSDHAPFWEKNIPAVMWTDTSKFRNPHYHQPTDTPDTLDYEFMAEVGKLLAIVVGRVVSGSSPIEAKQ
jgi:Zn-dependent M28 family amino/carboxypeptidase